MLRVEAEEELGSLSSQALNSVPKTDETNTTKSTSVAKNVKLRDSKLPGEHFVPVLPFVKNKEKCTTLFNSQLNVHKHAD